MRQLLTGAIGVFYAAFGAAMLIDSASWLSFMIGREVQAPLPGQHFIYDVGLAFLASGAGFLLAAIRPRFQAAALAACAFPALHALMHVIELAHGGGDRWAFDVAIIVAPALAGVVLAWSKSKTVAG